MSVFLQSIREIFGDVIDPAVNEAQVDQALAKLPAPVFWLLGKTGSGKSSIIRALTGSGKAEIGNGFRSCTKTSRVYAYPGETECLIRFLDTRGLGEVDYDPAEDILQFEKQAHVLIVVVKAADHALNALLEPLRKIRKKHPTWPLIVVQSTLHELYPPGTEHLVPYPYKTLPLPQEVPNELTRSLGAQRELFADLTAHFVPIDFTLQGDGFSPELYGLDELWATIDEVSPLGLGQLIRQSPDLNSELRDVHFWTAHPHILAYSAAAGFTAAVPIPMLDLPAVLAIQLKMLHAIASIYGQELTYARLREIAGALGFGFAARQVGREFLKLIPFFGSAAAGTYAAGCTYALGLALCGYFSYILEGHVPDKAKLKELYDKQLASSKPRFQRFVSKASSGVNTHEATR